MSNIFDAMGAQAFDVCALTFGRSAIWNDGTDDLSATVLFANPEDARKLPGAEMEYVDQMPRMEYKSTDLPGLFDKVREDTTLEEIDINDETYYIRDVKKIHDGLVVLVKLELKE